MVAEFVPMAADEAMEGSAEVAGRVVEQWEKAVALSADLRVAVARDTDETVEEELAVVATAVA